MFMIIVLDTQRVLLQSQLVPHRKQSLSQLWEQTMDIY